MARKKKGNKTRPTKRLNIEPGENTFETSYKMTPSGITHVISSVAAIFCKPVISLGNAQKKEQNVMMTPSTPSHKPLYSGKIISPTEKKVSRKLAIIQELEINKSKIGMGFINHIECQQPVKDVYKIIRKCTGSLGGNGSFGAIYGEATMGCMQRIVNLMKHHCEFDKSCSFIDVGSGLGKPNFHVAQDPGVKVSYGVELEKVRYDLGMHNLRHVMQFTKSAKEPIVHGNVFFRHGDITEAKTFDPFTHVYMFDVGFPPVVLEEIAQMFNASQAPFLICYHAPRLTIDKYGFDVEFIAQYPTSLHGSGESHMGYIYRHIGKELSSFDHSIVDPMFKQGIELMNGDPNDLLEHVERCNESHNSRKRITRSSSRRLQAQRNLNM